jgi:hypothetical protein
MLSDEYIAEINPRRYSSRGEGFDDVLRYPENVEHFSRIKELVRLANVAKAREDGDLMDIKLFDTPSKHPYGMLEGYKNASEKESVLAVILTKCIEAGVFVAVETVHSHPSMVEDGLLKEVGECKYTLTTKAMGLLFSVYGREEGT